MERLLRPFADQKYSKVPAASPSPSFGRRVAVSPIVLTLEAWSRYTLVDREKKRVFRV